MKSNMTSICDNELCQYHPVELTMEDPSKSVAVTIEDKDGERREIQSICTPNPATGKSVRLCEVCMHAVAAVMAAARFDVKEEHD